MSENEPTIWCIRAGSRDQAEEVFLKKNYVALGWSMMGNLAELGNDREAFKARLAETHPDEKPGAIPTKAGELFRFVNEVEVGDVVIYPSKADRQVHIGEIVGPYKYDKSVNELYPHLRPVKWLKVAPRTQFSQGALYEIGSALSIFQVKTYADEFTDALQGKVSARPVGEDPSADIEETTRDFVLKRLAQELKGHPLAEFIAHLLSTMGYRCRLSPEGPDGGIDIIAHKDELGFEPPIIKVQVKSTEGNVGDPAVSALCGKVSTGEYGLLITLGLFTPQARSFARSKSNLRLIDGSELVALIFGHYEQFDSRYKGLLPLKRVYAPQPVEEGND